MSAFRAGFARIAVAAASGAVQLLVLAGTAIAQCPHGTPWSGTQPIKVVLNTGIDDQLCTAASCPSFTDIQLTLLAALSEYYHATGSRLRFRYVGETSVAPGTVIEDHIHVFANPCSGGVLAVAAWGGGTWGKIRMCESNGSGDVNWNTFDRQPGGFSFHAVMLHELGHVIGLGHIFDCTTPALASIMSNYPPASDHLNGPDISFVNQQYGIRFNRDRPLWTHDGVSWLAGGATIGGIVANGRLAATNSRTSGNDVFVVWPDVHFGPNWGNFHITRYTPTSWQTLLNFFVPPPRPIYHPGVASTGNRVLLAWLGNRDEVTGRQNVIGSTFDAGVPAFVSTQTITDSISRTTNAGVSATFDPASNAFIAVWRSSAGSLRNGITYSVVGQSPSPMLLQDPRNGMAIKASDTPSIACGRVEIVGADNCLIAWIDAFHWQRPVRWAQGRVVSGQLVLSATRTHPYVTVGSASVAYWADSRFPWLIALNQGGTTTYTWRKPAPATASFQDERSIAARNYVTLPAAGSRLRGAEGRGYVFLAELFEFIERGADRARVVE